MPAGRTVIARSNSRSYCQEDETRSPVSMARTLPGIERRPPQAYRLRERALTRTYAERIGGVADRGTRVLPIPYVHPCLSTCALTCSCVRACVYLYYRICYSIRIAVTHVYIVIGELIKRGVSWVTGRRRPFWLRICIDWLFHVLHVFIRWLSRHEIKLNFSY